jgi:MFS family permease
VTTLRLPASGTRWLFVTLLATNALTLIAATAAAPTLPALAAVFGGTPETDRLVPLVLTLTPLAIGCAAPLAGLVIDRVGRRPVLAAGALGFAVAGSSAVLADSLTWVLVTRVGLGMAAACTMTGTTTVITDSYDGAERARVLALQAAIVGIVGTAVIVVSGALAELDWRAPFLIYLIGLPVVPLVLRHVPSVPSPVPPPSSGVPPVALRGAAVRPGGAERPLRGPAGRLGPLVLAMYLGMLVLQITNFLVAVHLPFDLADRFATTGTVAGVAVGLGTLAYAGGALVSVPLSQRIPVPGVVAVASGLLAVGHWGLTLAQLPVVVLSNLALGLGFGLIVPNLIAWLSTIGPVGIRGRLFGGMTGALFLGQFLSPFVWAPVIARVDRVGAFTAAAWLSAGAVGLGIAVWRRGSASRR